MVVVTVAGLLSAGLCQVPHALFPGGVIPPRREATADVAELLFQSTAEVLVVSCFCFFQTLVKM